MLTPQRLLVLSFLSSLAALACGVLSITLFFSRTTAPAFGSSSCTPMPPIPGGHTMGGLFVNSGADWSGLLPPSMPSPLSLSYWSKGQGNSDTYTVLQSGTSRNARDYIAFVDWTGKYRWLTGMNSGAPEGGADHGNWILYDSTSGAHRILMQSKSNGTGGPTYLNSNGNWPVIINGNTGLDNGEGTGGFQVAYGGGSAPGTAFFVDGSTGVSTFNRPAIFNGGNGVSLVSTMAIVGPVPVKLDPLHANQVLETTAADLQPGVSIGVCTNSAAAGGTCYVATTGIVALTLGSGRCSINDFAIVDTTTMGRVKCTAQFSPGTVIGVAMEPQTHIGSKLNVLLGLR